jgi:hypothetical protein
MHPAAASQSKLCELGSQVLARWPRTLAREERRGVERKEDTLTGAQVLVWTAWRGSARAASQRLPEEVFTSAPSA